MDNFTKAVNFNTLLLALGKSESYAGGVFETCPDYSPLDYAELCSADVLRIQEIHDEVRRTFDRLPGDVFIMTPDDSDWPADVKDVPFLYLRGKRSLLKKKGVCIVGARHPSDRGIELTRSTATEVGRAGYTVISGLAVGIDGCAHLQALADEKPTLAVIGTPVNSVYPQEHEKLQELIAQYGLVVSRFSPCLKTQRYYFMLRNLLMSQIGIASVIMEEDDGGGAVSQAKYSEKQNKKVFIFREHYDNESYVWPRSFRNPVVVSDVLQIITKLKAAPGKKKQNNPQPELFDSIN